MNQPSPRQRSGKSFADPSCAAFAAIVSPGVTLEGSIFALPVHGREAVWTTLRTASEIYDSLAFNGDASSDRRVSATPSRNAPRGSGRSSWAEEQRGNPNAIRIRA